MRYEEEISQAEDQELMERAARIKKRRKPANAGLLLTVFAVIVIMLIGGLVSYYYYTFQRQGYVSEKGVKEIWNETVDANNNLISKFKRVDKFAELDDTGNENFVDTIDSTNRLVRDGIYDLKSQTGLDVKGSTVVSKLISFLEDYSAMLGELKQVTNRIDEIEEESALKGYVEAVKTAEESYDELLEVNNGFLKTNFANEVFDMDDRMTALLKKHLEENGSSSEQATAKKKAAEQNVQKFVSAWQVKDTAAMATYLTAGAKGEFNPGVIQEDSVEVTGLAIQETTLEDNKIVIKAQIKRETPDETKTSETWEFRLLEENGKWLINSFANQGA